MGFSVPRSNQNPTTMHTPISIMVQALKLDLVTIAEAF